VNDSGHNSGVPDGWQAATIESLAEPRGIAYGVLKPGRDTPDGIPMLRVSDIKEGRVDESALYRIADVLDEEYRRTKLRGGEVVISIQGSVGRVAIVPSTLRGANISRTLSMIRLREPRLALWVQRALESPLIQDAMRSLIGGTTRDSLNLRDLRKLKIPIAPESHRSAVLDVVERTIDRNTAARRHLEVARRMVGRLRSAVLAAACSGRLTEDWRETHPDATPDQLHAQLLEAREATKARRATASSERGLTSEAQLELLPTSWSLVRLGDILDVGTGATPLRKNRAYYDHGTVPWVTSGAVNAGTITSPTELITPLALKETNVKLFPPGTLLVAMYGEGQTRGRVAELVIEAGTNQAVAAVLFPHAAESLKPFVRLFFEDSYQRVRAMSAGGVQPNLNLGIIKGTLLPLPPPEEQTEIVHRATVALAAADRLTAQIEHVANTLNDVSRASLAKAFRGEFVPTKGAMNPADHTAPEISVHG
jgi:type I restriction enzyme S subunit